MPLSNQENTLTDRIINRFKNNLIISIIIVLFSIVTGLALLTNSLDDIIDKVKSLVNKEMTPEEKAIKIVKEYFGYEEINVQKFVQVDFVGDNKNEEFYIVYYNGKDDVIDVFTSRQGFVENLYHHFDNFDEIDALHLTANNRNYFLSTSRSGSGAYLTIDIFTYDGIGKMKLFQNLGTFFQGSIFILKDRQFIDAGSKKYEIKLTKGQFKLIPYTERLNYELGSGSHVLSLNVKKGNLILTYDGKVMKINGGDGEYQSVETISINIDEQIIVDDNIPGDNSGNVRILVSDPYFDFEEGLFITLRPKMKGNTLISLSHSYTTWYHLDVTIN